jgi:hypothetical protein
MNEIPNIIYLIPKREDHFPRSTDLSYSIFTISSVAPTAIPTMPKKMNGSAIPVFMYNNPNAANGITAGDKSVKADTIPEARAY